MVVGWEGQRNGRFGDWIKWGVGMSDCLSEHECVLDGGNLPATARVQAAMRLNFMAVFEEGGSAGCKDGSERRG